MSKYILPLLLATAFSANAMEVEEKKQAGFKVIINDTTISEEEQKKIITQIKNALMPEKDKKEENHIEMDIDELAEHEWATIPQTTKALFVRNRFAINAPFLEEKIVSVLTAEVEKKPKTENGYVSLISSNPTTSLNKQIKMDKEWKMVQIINLDTEKFTEFDGRLVAQELFDACFIDRATTPINLLVKQEESKL